MVIVVVRDEHFSDLAEIGSCLCQSAEHAIAGVQEIIRSVDGQEI